MDRNILLRLQELNSRQVSRHLRAKILTEKLAERISKKHGTRVLLTPQIRTAAYLLGMETNSHFDPLGITIYEYHTLVEPRIPSLGKVTVSKYLGKRNRYSQNAAEVQAVQECFRTLGQNGQLNYSYERFHSVVSLV